MMSGAAKAEPALGGGLRFVACVADDVTREAVSRAVANLGWQNAKVRPGGIDAARRSIDITSPPRLVLVDLAESADPVEGLTELTQLCGPSTRFLAIGAVNDVTLYRQLVGLGGKRVVRSFPGRKSGWPRPATPRRSHRRAIA